MIPDFVVEAIDLTSEQTLEATSANQVSHEDEWLRCAADPVYFINTYCKVLDPTAADWIPFVLWPAQVEALQTVINNQLTVILKARQLGLSWLLLAYALWLIIFKPIATVAIFSRRDDEAMYLLGDLRLTGMYKRLPDWMKTHAQIVTNNAHEISFSNGSLVRAFPTGTGDSYTMTLAIADEFDLVPDQAKLIASVKPTIDAGGKMVLISRVDKSKPNSLFKQIYKAAKQRLNEWAPVFIPWFAHPDRDDAWYQAQVNDSEHNTGSKDLVYEQYPATDAEALAQKVLGKRISPVWLLACFDEWKPMELPDDAPSIPQLEIYVEPVPGRTYVLGGDPAEGNPTSDESSASIVDKATGEECAVLSGLFEPTIFAGYINNVGKYYNKADLMIERNNHGHTVIAWLNDHSLLKVLDGHDDKPGWLSSSKGKTLLYDGASDVIRDAAREGQKILHSFGTYTQLGSIEGATLRAPEGDLDDRADAWSLAQKGRGLVVTAMLPKAFAVARKPANDSKRQPDIAAVRAMVGTPRKAGRR